MKMRSEITGSGGRLCQTLGVFLSLGSLFKEFDFYHKGDEKPLETFNLHIRGIREEDEKSVRRLLQKTRQEIMVAWIKKVSVEVVRSGLILGIQLSLRFRRRFVPGLPRIPKSTDAQVPYIKWHLFLYWQVFAYNLCTSSCIL